MKIPFTNWIKESGTINDWKKRMLVIGLMCLPAFLLHPMASSVYSAAEVFGFKAVGLAIGLLVYYWIIKPAFNNQLSGKESQPIYKTVIGGVLSILVLFLMIIHIFHGAEDFKMAFDFAKTALFGVLAIDWFIIPAFKFVKEYFSRQKQTNIDFSDGKTQLNIIWAIIAIVGFYLSAVWSANSWIEQKYNCRNVGLSRSECECVISITQNEVGTWTKVKFPFNGFYFGPANTQKVSAQCGLY